MNTKFSASNRRSRPEDLDGLTRVELLVIIGMLAVIATIQVSAMSGAKGRTRVVVCSENVRQIAMALQIYGADNENKLPVLSGSAAWAWDVPASVTSSLMACGLQKRSFYCPSTAPLFTDADNFLNANSLWNFGFPAGTSEDSPNAFHIIGYSVALSGSTSVVNSRYQNTKITAEAHRVGTGSFYDSTATRVLVADVIISMGNSYPARETEPFQGIRGGFSKPHLSAHMVAGAVPNGANVGYKDGHVQWKKFNSPPAGFNVPSTSPWLSTEDTYTMIRTATSGPYFWW